jgi:hypothetical protein
MKYLACVSIAAALTGCLAQGGSDDSESTEQDVSTTYVDILDFEKTDQDLWYDTIHALNNQFNQECGDTYCEGDWSNLVPLTFGCSVTSKAGNVKDCVWTFAASQVDVDTRNAAIVVDAPVFKCSIKMKTTAVKLAKLLSTSSDMLRTPLPGAPSGATTIGEQLSDCFDHPIGAMPGTFSTTGTEKYVSARDYYKTSAGMDRWHAATTALVAGFDRVCGDTFCSSDYGDLQAMDFTCAVTKSSGNVKTCMWTFGGSYHVTPEHGGLLDVTAHTYQCTVDVDGSLSKLIDTLIAPQIPGQPDAIRRPLPGFTTTAYDAIAGCLP